MPVGPLVLLFALFQLSWLLKCSVNKLKVNQPNSLFFIPRVQLAERKRLYKVIITYVVGIMYYLLMTWFMMQLHKTVHMIKNKNEWSNKEKSNKIIKFRRRLEIMWLFLKKTVNNISPMSSNVFWNILKGFSWTKLLFVYNEFSRSHWGHYLIIHLKCIFLFQLEQLFIFFFIYRYQCLTWLEHV